MLVRMQTSSGGVEIPEYTIADIKSSTNSGQTQNIVFDHDIGVLLFCPKTSADSRSAMVAMRVGNTIKLLGQETDLGTANTINCTYVDSKTISFYNPNYSTIYKILNFYA